MSPHKKQPEEKVDESARARERVVRQAELALIQLNDEMKGKEPMHTREQYLAMRRRIMRAADLTEEDLMQRPVFAAGKGGFAPDVDQKLTWYELERRRDGSAKRDALDRGEATTRSLAAALKDHLAQLHRPPGQHGPVAGPGAQPPRFPPPVANPQTVEEKLAELDLRADQGAITPVQHEVRTHEVRHCKTWTLEQRGRIETALGALVQRWMSGEIDDARYEIARAEILA